MKKGCPSLNIQKASNGGHTMRLHPPPDAKGGYREAEERVYGKGEDEKMFSDARKHLGAGGGKQAAPAPKAKIKAGATKAGAIARTMADTDNY